MMRIAAQWGTIAACLSSGCIEIEGGAAELSWSLRTFEGGRVGCADAQVDHVRLCWEPITDGSVGGETCRSGRSFMCADASGVTGFDLAPGPTAFWIEPICADGQPADAGTYQVPPPIVRSVEEGQIVSLNSLLMVVSLPAGECPAQGCTCMRP